MSDSLQDGLWGYFGMFLQDALIGTSLSTIVLCAAYYMGKPITASASFILVTASTLLTNATHMLIDAMSDNTQQENSDSPEQDLEKNAEPTPHIVSVQSLLPVNPTVELQEVVISEDILMDEDNLSDHLSSGSSQSLELDEEWDMLNDELPIPIENKPQKLSLLRFRGK
ncbi:MAG: hypothetical protein SFW66_01250 [Gammaproteobacteria bacterium]|nr:hypothetical protein [Gammaproteobacteria bacterium]